MNERIKYLRKEMLKLTQEKFGERLGVGKSVLSQIENGRSGVTEQMFRSICREFSVNEDWLRNGTGDPFVINTVDSELAGYMGALLAQGDHEKNKYALLVLKLIVDEWDLVYKNIDTIKNILTWISESSEES